METTSKTSGYIHLFVNIGFLIAIAVIGWHWRPDWSPREVNFAWIGYDGAHGSFYGSVWTRHHWILACCVCGWPL